MKNFFFSFRTLSALTAAGFGFAMLTSASTADAGQSTANMTVTAEVAANCLITANPLDFGSYDPVGTNAAADLDGSSNIDVTCTDGTSAKIVVDMGTSGGSGRAMQNGAHQLDYELYSDSGRSIVWGAIEAEGRDYTGTGLQEAVTIYGRIPAGQNVPAGIYTDNVIATVTF